tara:strand:+ start:1528 stop:1965 length:438 start_codon:yes stop_codon:yes gene_type:complete
MINQGKKSIKGLVNLINSLVTGVTGSNVVGRVGKTSQNVLKKLGKFVTRIPLAGGLFAYIFVQTGKGLVIITTTADKLVDSGGKIITSTLSGAGKLSIWTLDTIKGVAKKVVSGVSGKTRRRKRRRKSKSRKKRKGRKTKRSNKQ